ncbi:GYD domain-containing protein [Seohaeicola saemankumensis]|nr:GYD domain-containing protein [Seohaeicola saemankumensis]MCA0873761.1 GYD domain-containing protein [Seohaeicola saemankumensis]
MMSATSHWNCTRFFQLVRNCWSAAKDIQRTGIFAFLGVVFLLSSQSISAEEERSRYYLGVGKPSAEAWMIMIENPTDREQSIGAALAGMGGEMISYFWGLADGNNYITVRLPDDPHMIQALYLSRLSQGVLKDYTFIELMTSADMVDALKRVPEVTAPVE